METILSIYKGILAVGVMLVIGNFFRALYWVFASIINRTEIDSVLVKRSKSLLVLGVLVAWFVSITIYLGEKMIYGKSTEYSTNIMFLVGILLLIITIVSAISAIVVAWSKNKQNRSCVPIFRNLVGMSFDFAIMMWLSTWAIS